MLTQAEIDALLAGAIEIEPTDEKDSVNLAKLMGEDAVKQPEKSETMTAKDEAEGKQVRPYNFWSPDRFSKDQLRAIELLHEELGERLTNTLPTFLRTSLSPRIVHTEQGRFHDFLSDLHPNSLFHLISLSPLPGQFLITISQEVSFTILEQRLGGKSETRTKNHVLTDIDQSLLEDLVENMLNDIKASWSKVASVEPKLVDSTINQHWVQMMIGNERMMMITFEMVINQITGTMNYYIPYSMLKPIINELNPHIIISGRKEKYFDVKARDTNFANLNRMDLPIRVVLGHCSLLMPELNHLQPGDVLVLDTARNQDLVIEVANMPRFMGKVGSSHKKLAVQITKKINPNGDTE
jgi:flagellar motor switch protein FliM